MDFGQPFSFFPNANQQPYMSQHNATYTPPYRNISFSRNDAQVASSSSNLTAATPGAFPGGPASVLPQTSYRAPAHKHAHHLHSIPPREKSTRTLIIDHMLWVHGRTRFAQARAELGMTDRTGGPSSPNYLHRTRPESYEEEDEDGSEGEEASRLKARSGNGDDEDERLGRQDIGLARSLRLRAEGLEKVVISMLEQPPPVIHPFNDQDVFTPPTSPKSAAPASSDPHRLPNGVRLRLALGTIINDLFARQAPHPPYRHTHAPNVKISTPSEHSPVPLLPSDLPVALTKLAPVSGAFAPVPQASHTVPARSAKSPQYSEFTQNYPGMPFQTLQQPLAPQPTPRNQRPHASPRTRSLYAAGADPSTANSPPAFRCPRHLHTACEICVEAKSSARHGGSNSSRGRAGSFGTSDRNNASNSWKAMPGGVGPGGGGITGWQDGSGIGSGLLRPGVRGSALRRKAREEGDSAAGGGNAKLSKLIPRFIRLSALVAAELGREARGEDGESDDGKEGERGAGHGSATAGSNNAPATNIPAGTPGRWTPPPSPAIPRATVQTQNQNSTQARERAQRRMYEHALRPSSEWYMLLAGLLTRAVLEGYLSAGWSGLQAVQCLLLVGLGINENASQVHDVDNEDDDEIDEDEEFAAFDPDELPHLLDAIKVLFPSLRNNASGLRTKAEDEFESEMYDRLKRFYDIPASTPDCATHMEDLAWQYPAEPVERAAVRFCEAIAKWRGKPELETYKKKPSPRPVDITSPGGSTAMTIESLVHSNPTSPMMANASTSHRAQRRLKKPSIEEYFLQPPGSARRESGTWTRNSNKRYRDADDAGRPEPAKRMYT
ncbi:hypothetical protein CPB84DRAFT_1763776 [Gymnopilus junonius]|uniref:Uncharacterized protein n=1 Tax=Gymnopilus junonius TaxID=109634 RepID=A0A9P5TT93_GYMJU|nr:hypothetical protein CPB84DRAFT_1763776 [Gymnopilus junonius]